MVNETLLGPDANYRGEQCGVLVVLSSDEICEITIETSSREQRPNNTVV